MSAKKGMHRVTVISGILHSNMIKCGKQLKPGKLVLILSIVDK
jgi:hypothetical protein